MVKFLSYILFLILYIIILNSYLILYIIAEDVYMCYF